METLIIKKKTYDILRQIGNDCYKVICNDKIFFAKVFTNKNDLKKYIKLLKFLANCGLNVPKIEIIDKKSFVVLTQFIDGENALQVISKQELSEEYYKSIFALAFRCKLERICINFSPENFVLFNGKLYYISREIRSYVEEDNFINKYVRLWFYTSELIELLKHHNLPVHNKRIKNEYAMNKEILLTTIKYYL